MYCSKPISLNKIDRFLACEGFMNKWGLFSATILPKRFSDHSPVMLLSEVHDFGPCPFGFFNSWCFLEGLDEETGKKLIYVKNDIKIWRADSNRKELEELNCLLLKIDDLELKAE
uniref:Endonuclease/exonuclease/phosphatase domain-containing protein n=1 Tax=Lactuca sativa TaxID=4236 RepID=A0A9R1V8I5_LACSA|nr:hypothetical protein LSAT_V11C600333800 [Lactuca sativa]